MNFNDALVWIKPQTLESLGGWSMRCLDPAVGGDPSLILGKSNDCFKIWWLWVLQTLTSSNNRGIGFDCEIPTAGLHQLHYTSVSSLGFHSEAQLQRQPLRLIASGCSLGRCLICRHRGVLGQCCQVGPHDTRCAQPQGRYQQGGQGQTNENVKGKSFEKGDTHLIVITCYYWMNRAL